MDDDRDIEPAWVKAEGGDFAGSSGGNTPTQQTYKPRDDPRLYCDKCTACIIWHCGGITARHHFIHIQEFEYFTKDADEWEYGLLSSSNYFKHTDRDSGM